MSFQAKQLQGSPVYLNIYDITELNYWFHPFGLGAYHTSITVNQKEYYFGSHPYNSTGIAFSSGSELCQPIQPTHVFREQKYLGHTIFSQQAINQILQELGSSKFTGINYHLTRCNCNHFSKEFSRRLFKKEITPGYINRLAFVAECLRCLWEGQNGDIVLGGKMREKLSKWWNKREYFRIPGQNYSNV